MCEVSIEEHTARDHTLTISGTRVDITPDVAIWMVTLSTISHHNAPCDKLPCHAFKHTLMSYSFKDRCFTFTTEPPGQTKLEQTVAADDLVPLVIKHFSVCGVNSGQPSIIECDPLENSFTLIN